MTTRAPKLTRDEARERDRQLLEAAVNELKDSEGFTAWLRARAAFHTYSFNNTLLIAMQRPNATRVAGFHSWRKLQRTVRKGERAIKIMAPRTITVTNADGDDEKVVYFRPVPVFDITQTDGEDLPELERTKLTTNEHSQVYERLVAYATDQGWPVTEEALEPALGGYYSPRENRIAINQAGSVDAKLKTLIHELAHAHGISYTDYTRPQAEVIAESVAYLVSCSIGLDASLDSIPYIASWDDANSVKAFAQIIHETASTIEKALTPGDPA